MGGRKTPLSSFPNGKNRRRYCTDRHRIRFNRRGSRCPRTIFQEEPMSTSKTTRVPMFRQILVISQPDTDPVWIDLSKTAVNLTTIADADFSMLARGAIRVQDCMPMAEMSLSDTTMHTDENTHEVFA